LACATWSCGQADPPDFDSNLSGDSSHASDDDSTIGDPAPADSPGDTDSSGDSPGDTSPGDDSCIECLPDECGAHPPRCGTPTEGGTIYCGACPQCTALEEQIIDELESIRQCTVGVDDCVSHSGLNGPSLVCCGFIHSSGADPSQVVALVQSLSTCTGLGYPSCSCGGPAPHACIAGHCQPTLLPCGDETCDRGSEICRGTIVPVGQEMTHRCVPLPPECDLDRTCGCLGSQVCNGELSDCLDVEEGRVTCHCSLC